MTTHRIETASAQHLDSIFGKLLAALDAAWQAVHPESSINFLHTNEDTRREIVIRHGNDSISAGYLKARFAPFPATHVCGIDYRCKEVRVGSVNQTLYLDTVVEKMEGWLDLHLESKQRWEEWKKAEMDARIVTPGYNKTLDGRTFVMRRAEGGEGQLTMTTRGVNGELKQYIKWSIGRVDTLDEAIKAAILNEGVVK